MDDEKVETQEQVAEDATPETDTEAVEQREDDYQALARRIDDVERIVREIREVAERIESGIGVFVEAGAVINESDAIDTPAEVEAVAEALDDFVEIDDLDLM